MDFKTFWRGLKPGKPRAEFAARCGTTPAYLELLCLGLPKHRCGEALAICIERESFGVVTVETLRPDVDWAVIRNSGQRRRRSKAQAPAVA